MPQPAKRFSDELRTTVRLRAEEEARLVLVEARATADARAAAREKAQEEEKLLAAAARKSACEREAAIAQEEARIDAMGKDEWFFTRGQQQYGPVPLAALRSMAADETLEPPVKSVFTEGMDRWKPIYDVRRVCEPLVSETNEHEIIAAPVIEAAPAEIQTNECSQIKEDAMVRDTAEMQAKEAAQRIIDQESKLRAAAEAKAAEEARLRAIAEAKAADEARAAEAVRLKSAEEARRKAEAEAKALEESQRRIAAEAKAAEEARLRAIAEAKAADEARAAEAVRLKSAEEARCKAEAEAKALEESQRRIAAEAKAVEEARLRALAEARACEEARLRNIAEAKAADETRAASALKAKIEQESALRAIAEAKAQEEARAREEIEALAKEEERIAAIARKKAEQDAKAKAEFMAKASEAKRLGEISRKSRRKAKRAAAENVLKTTSASEAKPPDDKPEPARPKPGSGWFHTRDGERVGPVTFAELRAIAADSSLDPRLDMVWKNGMDSWTQAGRIDGLFERANTHEEKKEAASISFPPPAKTNKKRASKGLYFPGSRRPALLFFTLLFPVIWQFAISALTPYVVKHLGPALSGNLLPYSAVVPLAVLVVFGLRRLTNLGMNRWWYLAVLAPVVNLWLAYRCFACPPGYASHKKMDRSGFALAFCYWLIVIWGVSSLPSTTAPLYCTINSGKLPDHLRTAIHGASISGNWKR